MWSSFLHYQIGLMPGNSVKKKLCNLPMISHSKLTYGYHLFCFPSLIRMKKKRLLQLHFIIWPILLKIIVHATTDTPASMPISSNTHYPPMPVVKTDLAWTNLIICHQFLHFIHGLPLASSTLLAGIRDTTMTVKSSSSHQLLGWCCVLVQPEHLPFSLLLHCREDAMELHPAC